MSVVPVVRQQAGHHQIPVSIGAPDLLMADVGPNTCDAWYPDEREAILDGPDGVHAATDGDQASAEVERRVGLTVNDQLP